MPLLPGKSKTVINTNTATLIKEGYPPPQAYAIANSHARGKKHDPHRNPPKKKGTK